MKPTMSVGLKSSHNQFKPKPPRTKPNITVFRHHSIDGFVEKVKGVTVYYTLIKNEYRNIGKSILFAAYNKSQEYHSFIMSVDIQHEDAVSLVKRTMKLEDVPSIAVWIAGLKEKTIELLPGRVENIYDYYKS